MGIPGSGRRVEFDCVLVFDFRKTGTLNFTVSC